MESINESSIRLKDVDEGLSYKILEKWDLAFNFYIDKKVGACFRTLKGLYFMIAMYDFQGKQELENLINAISQHVTALEGSYVLTEDERIMVGEAQYELGELVNMLFKMLPEAFSSLGKWLKVFKTKDDFDEQFSKETFGTKVTLLDDKKKELLELDKEVIINMCSPNIIHFLHSRKLIIKAQVR